MSEQIYSDWAVVGGGMMGMALALQLAEAGQRVTVYEAAPEWGGLTSAWNINDEVRWDRFYHVNLLSDSYLRALLDKIGLEQEVRWVVTKTGFYSGGKLHSMSNAIEFLRFPVLNILEKLRLGFTISYASRYKNWQRLEQISVEKWLRKLSGNSTFEKVWLPLLKAKLGDTYQSTSAAFIWAYINRMYKARRSGLKTEMFGYVPGGYARVLDQLTQRLKELGVVLKTSHPVSQVTQTSNGLKVEFIKQPNALHEGVIFTTPSPLVSKVCPQLPNEAAARLSRIEYLGVVCASLLLKKPLSKYYVTNITDDWVPLTGIIEMSTVVDPREFGGHHLVYLPQYVRASDDAAFNEPDDSIQERMLATLERMYPSFSREDVVAFKVARARNVMSLPTLDYSNQLTPMQTSVPGLYVINSSYIVQGTLNVNETLQIAQQGFELIKPRLGDKRQREKLSENHSPRAPFATTAADT
ncbi:MAG TPA: NAD(P)/FAD-dependent oxidoreductase [Pirellulaceae bacterium]|nr:NAD(P)/FAD-dependent oxidoreductase [Pirellulaceae bacterium]HMO92529.1 NAD(P)/FAD-dependent oxidoreductase [Pirellulaceae bacterium]HMP68988.1 NAD(P)/FAD-dependent oxidoreductase [Pirellulaceae bacterium]